MTHYEKLMNGTKEDMVHELVLAIKWARELPEKDWKCIVNGWRGLEGFVQDTLDVKIPSGDDAIAEALIRNKYNCKYAYRTYEDYDGAEYWCTLYNKDCDSCR